jgi:branched-chain amino acid transport system permease protein
MRLFKILGLLVLLVLVLVFPVLLSPNTAVNNIAVYTLIYAMAVTGWNIFSGYTGYISIGHAVYFGLGAYTMALARQHWDIPGGFLPFLLLPLAALVAGVFAIPLGFLALRVRRYAFAVVTIALMFVFQLLAYNLRAITNGTNGVFLPPPPWSADVFDLPFYYVTLGILLLAIGLSWRVRHSKYGLGLLAIRDDEDRAQGLGVRTGPYKLGVYVISALFVGMAGAIFALYIGVIYPQFTFDPIVDVNITTMAFLGGLGTLAGPLVGAVLVVPLQQFLTLQFGGESLNLILFGAFLLVILLAMPQGIIPSLQRMWSNWKASRTKTVHQDSAANQEQPALLAERGGEG